MLTFNLNIIPRVKDAYVVGGSIRDILANRVPNDYDFVVAGSAKEFAKSIAEKTNGHVISLGKPGFSLYRVSSGIGCFDVSSVSGETIVEDLSKRDFTVNAMAVEIFSGELVDPFNGMADLKQKKIKMVSEQAFIEDPVRLLRAYRLAAKFNFKIEPETQAAVKRNCRLIQKAPRERIHSELLGVLKLSGSADYVALMIASGLLFSIIPELSVLPGLISEKTGMEMVTYEKLEALLANSHVYIPDEHQALNHLDENAGLLKLAVLFNNIVKTEKKAGGRVDSSTCCFSFLEVDTSIVSAVCDKLRLTGDEKNYISGVIGNSKIPAYLYSLSDRRVNPCNSFSRFFYKCKEIVPDIVFFALACNGPSDDRFAKFLKVLLFEYYKKFIPLYHLDPLITRQDLISEFSLEPSPGFKTILGQVREARLEGEIASRQEALEMVKRLIS